MAQPKLTIDLQALADNWRALDAKSDAQTGAAVKADAYGLGIAPVAKALADAGTRQFFVATAEEGAEVREVLGAGPKVYVFSGHMAGDAHLIRDSHLIPLLNSPEQVERHLTALPGTQFGIQLDSGMNRLGLEPSDWGALRERVLASAPRMVMSHLACADEPDHAMNQQQRNAYLSMVEGIDAPRSLAATGGILLGSDYHFDVTRPGIGLYGGAPYVDARPVVQLSLPVIQTRTIEPGESVGYGNTFIASRQSRIATVSAGYADGLLRAMGPRASLMAGDTECPVAGRVSMDLIGVDVTDASEVPDALELMGPNRGVDLLADWAGTIGYEILTSLGHRYDRVYRS